MEDFLRNKYTNADLYSWMQGQVQTLYYQAYTLAYDLAKKDKKVFRFVRQLHHHLILFSSDTGMEGCNSLLSGECLFIALKQLEAAYPEKTTLRLRGF